MEPLDFSGKTSNEILEELAATSEWLAAQYEAAKPLLDSSAAELATYDTEAQFAWQAGRQHLLVLAAATRKLKKHVADAPTYIGFLDIDTDDA